MAKNGRTCDFTGTVFSEGAPDTGTIVVTVGENVTTYDVTLDGAKKATQGWPEGASRVKFKRPRKDADVKAGK